MALSDRLGGCYKNKLKRFWNGVHRLINSRGAHCKDWDSDLTPDAGLFKQASDKP